MGVYYNEFDPHAAEWLRNLSDSGEIPEGAVDERDVRQVTAEEVGGYRVCHWFGGIGGWPLAFRLAGIPDEPGRVVWSASLPCQPFSTAGKGKGEEDERHLWPVFAALVRQCLPDLLVGEQVAGVAGYQWLDGVRADLEQEGYAVGAAVLPAACLGAPHQRHRIFWCAVRMAESKGARGFRLFDRDEPCPQREGEREVRGGVVRLQQRPAIDEQFELRRLAGRLDDAPGGGRRARQRAADEGREQPDAAGSGETGGVADADGDGRGGEGLRLPLGRPRQAVPDASGAGADRGVGHPGGEGLQGRQRGDDRAGAERPGRMPPAWTGRDGFWDDFALLHCTDGKARRTQPGLFPLVDGFSFRLADGRTREDVSRAKVLQGVGNAIVPPVAATFLRAVLECLDEGAF